MTIFRFDGTDVPFRRGQSVAAALLAAGVPAVRRTRGADAPRGLFCGIGVCFDCLATVDGQGGVRTCQILATPGLEVTSAAPEATAPAAPRARPDAADAVADLAIVGGGPAGMAAAAAALEGGLRVVLVDAGAQVGGQYWRFPPAGSDVPRGEDLHHDLATYAALRDRLTEGERRGLLDLRRGAEVWASVRSGEQWRVHLAPTSPRPGVITARWLLVATGAHDLALPFPGWDLPGVMTVGGLQALLKGSDVVPGHRVVVGGSGPFLLPVAAGLAARGAAVLALCEADRPAGWVRGVPTVLAQPAKIAEAARYALALARHRVPVRPATVVVRALGRQRLEAVELARLDRSGRIDRSTVERIEVDALGVSWGFVPRLDLLTPHRPRMRRGVDGQMVVAVDDWQACNVPGLLAAGETCGVGGAGLALAEGRLAGLGVRAALGQRLKEAEVARLRRQIAALRRFADLVQSRTVVPGGWLDQMPDDTVLCRCEESRLGDARAALARDGDLDPGLLKHHTRAGMGWCQGRICGPATRLLCDTPDRVEERLVATPVRLGDLTPGSDMYVPENPATKEPT